MIWEKFRIAAVITCVFFPGASLCRAGGGVLDRALGHRVAQNNGVLIGGYALGYFGLPVRINRVAEALGAGAAWARPVGAKSMREFLAREGLACRPVRVTGPGAVGALLHARGGAPRLLLLSLSPKRVRLVGQIGRHWVALVAEGKRGYFLADPGNWAGWMAPRQFRGRVLPNLNQAGLVVAPPVYSVGRAAPVHVVHEALSPGRYVRVPVWVANPTDAAVTIVSQKGSCDCFRSAALFPPDLRPGGIGMIVFSFYTNRVPVGTSEREVTLGFSGAGVRPLQAIVKIILPRSVVASSPSWSPHRVSFGAVANAASLGFFPLTVRLPASASVLAVRASNPDIRIIPMMHGSAPGVDAGGQRVFRYAVDLTRIPRGWFSAVLTVDTRPRRLTFSVPITGRVVGSSRRPRPIRRAAGRSRGNVPG